MLQLGKKYNVVQPKTAINLGMADVVKIIKQEGSHFLGDNGIWYNAKGRHELPEDALGVGDYFNLNLEPID